MRARHGANLMYVLDDLSSWQSAMVAELGAPEFRGAWIRIHDSGDFFSDAYLRAWLDVCRVHPDTNFYAYTKESSRFRALVEPDPPPNFLWVYSFRGTQDNALDLAVDRVADVFPDEAAIAAAGWTSQEASDLLAVLGPRLVGVPANRIPFSSSGWPVAGSPSGKQRSTPNALLDATCDSPLTTPRMPNDRRLPEEAPCPG